jgi:hypothetical protein
MRDLRKYYHADYYEHAIIEFFDTRQSEHDICASSCLYGPVYVNPKILYHTVNTLFDDVGVDRFES